MSARQTARTNPHQQSIKKSIMSRVRVLYAIFAIVAVAIFGMILVTQYGPNGGPLRNRSDLKCYKMLDVPASRGNIYAHDGRILATDSPSYNISLDFTVLDMSAEEFNREANALADSLSRTIPAYSKGYFVQRLHAIRNKALRGGPGSQNQRWRLESSPMTRSRSGTATCWSASSTSWRLGAVFSVMSFSLSRRNGEVASFSRKRLSRCPPPIALEPSPGIRKKSEMITQPPGFRNSGMRRNTVSRSMY